MEIRLLTRCPTVRRTGPLLLPTLALAVLSCGADPVGLAPASTSSVLAIRVLQDGLLLDDRIVIRVGEVAEEFEPGTRRTNFVVPIGPLTIAVEDLASNCQVTDPDVLDVTATPGGWHPIDLRVLCGLKGEFQGARLAWVGGGELRLLDSGGVRAWSGPLRPHGSPSWAPDGERLAFTVGGGSGGTQVAIASSNGMVINTVDLRAGMVAWAPVGEIIAMLAPSRNCENDSGVWLAEGPDWMPSELAIDCELLGGGYALTWSPDGDRIAIPAKDSVTSVMLISVDNGQTDRIRFTESLLWIDGLAWSRNGDRLLISLYDWDEDWFGYWSWRTVTSLDLDSHELSLIGTWDASNTLASQSGLAWLSGETEFLVEVDSPCETILMASIDGRPGRPLLPCGQGVHGIAVSPKHQ